MSGSKSLSGSKIRG